MNNNNYYAECIENNKTLFVFNDERNTILLQQNFNKPYECVFVPESYQQEFINQIKETPQSNRLKIIIAYDGLESEKLIKKLDNLGIKAYKCNLAGESKSLEYAIEKESGRLENLINECLENPAEMEKHQESAFFSMYSFIEHIQETKTARLCYKTGFNNLDDLLGGGLYAGLITIGGISSVGKTTFILQLADQVAQSGNDVLYFSLEMAKDELMSKSLSRISFTKSLEKKCGNTYAQTSLNILTGKFLGEKSYTDHINECVEDYCRYAGNLFFKIGNFQCGIDEIKRDIKKHIEVMNKKPLVIVDYLQIMTPSAECKSYTDKQIIDDAVKGLKVLSRDLQIPIIVVSALNRASYTDPITMAAFKESGAIEYTSDVLLGIQYKGMDYQSETENKRKERIQNLFKEQEEKAGTPGKFNDIEIKIMKNRNGQKGTKAYFEYSQMFNYFRPAENEKDEYDF